ncbi:hypothetical protein FACS189485_03690 [Spirochaetia bacterium]|nr:hypothetical protein FACS189485_03690 [Spirochaetia bacterium]
MIEVIAGFENVSRAIMAEQALTEQGFDVRVMPMPSGIRAGCGFCLRFLPEDIEKAAAFLRERGLSIKEAWEKKELQFQQSYRKVVIHEGQ